MRTPVNAPGPAPKAMPSTLARGVPSRENLVDGRQDPLRRRGVDAFA